MTWSRGLLQPYVGNYFIYIWKTWKILAFSYNNWISILGISFQTNNNLFNIPFHNIVTPFFLNVDVLKAFCYLWCQLFPVFASFYFFAETPTFNNKQPLSFRQKFFIFISIFAQKIVIELLFQRLRNLNVFQWKSLNKIFTILQSYLHQNCYFHFHFLFVYFY